MNVDFTQVLKKLDGEPIMDWVDEKGGETTFKEEVLTLKSVCIRALLEENTVPRFSELDEEEEEETILSEQDKVRYYKLAKAIYNGTTTELSAADIVRIKKQVGLIYPLLIVGQVAEMLEEKNR